MIPFATDEDIAVRASGDFEALCPRDQVVAAGNDGAFNPGSPWTLVSASVDFLGQGLRAGQVARLGRPASSFGANGELFAIESVATGAITLRRKGQPCGVGQPPAPAAGLTGVEFSVRTLGPQIGRASYDLDARFGIDDRVAGRRSVDLGDPFQLREAAVLTVLYRQYQDQSRAGSRNPETGVPDDPFALKARIIKEELDEVLDRLALRWGVDEVERRDASTTRFSTRLSR